MALDTKIFMAAFSTLFLAELGDKTQLAVITLSASTGKPNSVFWGAVLALALVTFLGVFVGQGLLRWIPEHVLKRLMASLFIAIGVWMLVKP